jgi:Ni,Fe-hydrogenase III small subunit/ferredoxin
MAWVLRGLREGIVTSRYPRRPDGYGDGFRASVSVAAPTETRSAEEERRIAALCPTGAIHRDDRLRVDRGSCIVCGRCVEADPDRFSFEHSPELSTLGRQALVVPRDDDDGLDDVRAGLAARVQALRRSIHIRHVDAGSDGAEEWEVAALTNPVYDVQRLGIFFTATPRHADVLLVTGVGTTGMAGPLRRTFDAMPDPKVVIAAGTDAVSGGLVHPSYATGSEPGVGSIVPVDVWVPGSPPSPFSLLHGILIGIGLLAEGPR